MITASVNKRPHCCGSALFYGMDLEDQMNDERLLNMATDDDPVLLVVLNTPVKVKPGVLVNLLGLLSGLLLRVFSPTGSVAHELAGDTALAHGLLLGGSLDPLPIVDGGVMLKWG